MFRQKLHADEYESIKLIETVPCTDFSSIFSMLVAGKPKIEFSRIPLPGRSSRDLAPLTDGLVNSLSCTETSIGLVQLVSN